MILDPKRRIDLHRRLDQLLDETDFDHGILFIREVDLRVGDQLVRGISTRGIVGKDSTILRDLVTQIRRSSTG
ncbi:MAG: hypothetical protein K0U16_07465 [Gammaproteobacteria bacterium]|nr:hypothetical protein [Gammaproteobacteria bacterium]